MSGVPTGSPGGAAPPPPPPQAPQPGAMQPKKPNSGKGIASMVLGILGVVVSICGFFIFGSIVALILGIIGLVLGSQAKKEIAANPNLGGEGMAKAGWILGIISVVLGAIGTIVWIVAIAAS